VAGAIAQAVADRFKDLSPDILVENGGDLYLHSTKPRLAALLAKPVHGARLALNLQTREFPLALCTSSATIGHSLSFGAADLVTVKARSGALADAAATALGNLARTPQSMPLVLERAQELRDQVAVRGVDLHAVEARLQRQFGAAPELRDDAGDLLAAQAPRDLVVLLAPRGADAAAAPARRRASPAARSGPTAPAVFSPSVTSTSTR